MLGLAMYVGRNRAKRGYIERYTSGALSYIMSDEEWLGVDVIYSKWGSKEGVVLRLKDIEANGLPAFDGVNLELAKSVGWEAEDLNGYKVILLPEKRGKRSDMILAISNRATLDEAKQWLESRR